MPRAHRAGGSHVKFVVWLCVALLPLTQAITDTNLILLRRRSGTSLTVPVVAEEIEISGHGTTLVVGFDLGPCFAEPQLSVAAHPSISLSGDEKALYVACVDRSVESENDDRGIFVSRLYPDGQVEGMNLQWPVIKQWTNGLPAAGGPWAIGADRGYPFTLLWNSDFAAGPDGRAAGAWTHTFPNQQPSINDMTDYPGSPLVDQSLVFTANGRPFAEHDVSIVWKSDVYRIITHRNNADYADAPFSVFRFDDGLAMNIPPYRQGGETDRYLESVLDPEPLLDDFGQPLKILSHVRESANRFWVLAYNPVTKDGGMLVAYNRTADATTEGQVNTIILFSELIVDPTTVLNAVGRFECAQGADSNDYSIVFVVYVLTTLNIRAYRGDTFSLVDTPMALPTSDHPAIALSLPPRGGSTQLFMPEDAAHANRFCGAAGIFSGAQASPTPSRSPSVSPGSTFGQRRTATLSSDVLLLRRMGTSENVFKRVGVEVIRPGRFAFRSKGLMGSMPFCLSMDPTMIDGGPAGTILTGNGYAAVIPCHFTTELEGHDFTDAATGAFGMVTLQPDGTFTKTMLYSPAAEKYSTSTFSSVWADSQDVVSENVAMWWTDRYGEGAGGRPSIPYLYCDLTDRVGDGYTGEAALADGTAFVNEEQDYADMQGFVVVGDKSFYLIATSHRGYGIFAWESPLMQQPCNPFVFRLDDDQTAGSAWAYLGLVGAGGPRRATSFWIFRPNEGLDPSAFCIAHNAMHGHEAGEPQGVIECFTRDAITDHWASSVRHLWAWHTPGETIVDAFGRYECEEHRAVYVIYMATPTKIYGWVPTLDIVVEYEISRPEEWQVAGIAPAPRREKFEGQWKQDGLDNYQVFCGAGGIFGGIGATPSPSASPSTSPTPSGSATPQASFTPSPTVSASNSYTPSLTASRSSSASWSASGSVTASRSGTAATTTSPTISPSSTATQSVTGSATVTPSVTPSPTVTAAVTGSTSVSASSTALQSVTASTTVTPSVTPSPTVTAAATGSTSVSASSSASQSVTSSTTATPSTPSTTVTAAVTGSTSVSASSSASQSVTSSTTATPSVTPSTTVTPTMTPTAAVTRSTSTTASPAASQSTSASVPLAASLSRSPSATPGVSGSQSMSSSPVASQWTSASATVTASPTALPITFSAVSGSLSVTASPTASHSVSASASTSTSWTPSMTTTMAVSTSPTFVASVSVMTANAVQVRWSVPVASLSQLQSREVGLSLSKLNTTLLAAANYTHVVVPTERLSTVTARTLLKSVALFGVNASIDVTWAEVSLALIQSIVEGGRRLTALSSIESNAVQVYHALQPVGNGSTVLSFAAFITNSSDTLTSSCFALEGITAFPAGAIGNYVRSLVHSSNSTSTLPALWSPSSLCVTPIRWNSTQSTVKALESTLSQIMSASSVANLAGGLSFSATNATSAASSSTHPLTSDMQQSPTDQSSHPAVVSWQLIVTVLAVFAGVLILVAIGYRWRQQWSKAAAARQMRRWRRLQQAPQTKALISDVTAALQVSSADTSFSGASTFRGKRIAARQPTPALVSTRRLVKDPDSGRLREVTLAPHAVMAVVEALAIAAREQVEEQAIAAHSEAISQKTGQRRNSSFSDVNPIAPTTAQGGDGADATVDVLGGYASADAESVRGAIGIAKPLRMATLQKGARAGEVQSSRLATKQQLQAQRVHTVQGTSLQMVAARQTLEAIVQVVAPQIAAAVLSPEIFDAGVAATVEPVMATTSEDGLIHVVSPLVKGRPQASKHLVQHAHFSHTKGLAQQTRQQAQVRKAAAPLQSLTRHERMAMIVSRGCSTASECACGGASCNSAAHSRVVAIVERAFETAEATIDVVASATLQPKRMAGTAPSGSRTLSLSGLCCRAARPESHLASMLLAAKDAPIKPAPKSLRTAIPRQLAASSNNPLHAAAASRPSPDFRALRQVAAVAVPIEPVPKDQKERRAFSPSPSLNIPSARRKIVVQRGRASIAISSDGGPNSFRVSNPIAPMAARPTTRAALVVSGDAQRKQAFQTTSVRVVRTSSNKRHAPTSR